MRAVMVMALIVVAASAGAWNEPDGFRGVPWGSPESVVREQLKARACSNPSDKVLGDRICLDRYGTIGEIPVQLLFGFRDDRLIGVHMTFDTNNFSMLEGIFIERYGRPTKTSEDAVQNRMGARYMNRQHEWMGERVFVMIRRYAGKLTEGSAVIWQKSEYETWTRQRDEQRKKGAGDL